MSDWFSEAKKLKAENPDYWTRRRLADKFGISMDGVKKAFQRDRANQSTEPGLSDQILKELQKERPIKDLCDKFKITERVLRASLEDLSERGFLFSEAGGNIRLQKDVLPAGRTQECNWKGEKIIRFGVATDTQLGSIHQQLTHLHTMYDIFKSEGIEDVYNAGDFSDGYKMRPGHEYELFVHGADAQEDYIVENYPKREGVKTLLIGGNHDAAHIKNGGRDIGKGIASRRPDIKYLGMYNAKIPLTPNCILEMNHPWDGASYAISYSIQKYMDSMMGGDKPHILLNAHHHKALYIFYRNIHAFETGCFQAQTSFERGKRIAVMVGGWIIEIHVHDDGTISRCKGEFFPFYKMIENDYKKG